MNNTTNTCILYYKMYQTEIKSFISQTTEQIFLRKLSTACKYHDKFQPYYQHRKYFSRSLNYNFMSNFFNNLRKINLLR